MDGGRSSVVLRANRFFSIIFGNVDRIGDWTKWEVVLLVGTHQIIAQLFQAFFFVNVANIPELVRMGNWIPSWSCRSTASSQFPRNNSGSIALLTPCSVPAVVIVSLSKLGMVPNPASVLLYLVSLCFGIAVHYSIMLGLAAVSFWIIRAQGLVYGYFNFLNIARYPDVIFPRLFRLIFGWVIPVVIIANIPARLLIKSIGQPFPLMLHLSSRRPLCSGFPGCFGTLRWDIIPAPARNDCRARFGCRRIGDCACHNEIRRFVDETRLDRDARLA